MPDKKLTVLVGVIIALSLGHDIDHFVRGDFRWSLAGPAPVLAVLLTKYATLGFGLYVYLKNKVGPLFWAIVAGISVALAWLAHFSPFSEQTPQSIYRAYATSAGGAVAVSVLACSWWRSLRPRFIHNISGLDGQSEAIEVSDKPIGLFRCVGRL